MKIENDNHNDLRQSYNEISVRERHRITTNAPVQLDRIMSTIYESLTSQHRVSDTLITLQLLSFCGGQ